VKSRRALLVLVVTGLLVGCTVGPDYRRPEVLVPAAWREAEQPGVSPGVAAVTEWWRTFQDPVLDRLVQRAVAANLDVKVATARVREARALRGIAAADRWPAVDASGTAARVRESEHVVPRPPGFDFEHSFFQVGLDASWELDFWGQVRRSVEAADADMEAAEDARRDVVVILLAEVARNLVEVRGAEQRLAIAHQNIQTQQESVELTRVRFDAGLGTEVDVAQARTLLATTQAQVPGLEAGRDAAIHRLGVLLGQAPGALVDELRQVERIPSGPPSVPVGLPSELLRRRADVRRAERELAAATARIGVATADLFPRFALTGTLGVAATDAADVFMGASRFWSLGPQVVWPLFAGGRIRANIRVQEARQQAALARYEQAVLSALEDTETALVKYGQEQARRQALERAVDSSQLAVRLSGELYTRGLQDFLTVLDTQRALYVTQDQLVQSEQAVAADLITVYKALGGGWEAALEDAPPPNANRPMRSEPDRSRP
jgi:NodT family efflux transporter outer membrane factor (OMF) lipoprotein